MSLTSTQAIFVQNFDEIGAEVARQTRNRNETPPYFYKSRGGDKAYTSFRDNLDLQFNLKTCLKQRISKITFHAETKTDQNQI